MITLIDNFSIGLVTIREGSGASGTTIAENFSAGLFIIPERSGNAPTLIAGSFSIGNADEEDMVDLTTHSVYTRIAH